MTSAEDEPPGVTYECSTFLLGRLKTSKSFDLICATHSAELLRRIAVHVSIRRSAAASGPELESRFG